MYFDVGIGKDRCARLVKFYAENGVARPENRGGARRSGVHDAKRQAVIQHISSFTCRASHYATGQLDNAVMQISSGERTSSGAP